MVGGHDGSGMSVSVPGLGHDLGVLEKGSQVGAGGNLKERLALVELQPLLAPVTYAYGGAEPTGYRGLCQQLEEHQLPT